MLLVMMASFAITSRWDAVAETNRTFGVFFVGQYEIMCFARCVEINVATL